jgi:hypothetical protein
MLSLVVAALCAACGDDTPTAPTDPTGPIQITRTFPETADTRATLTPHGGVIYPFAVQQSGTITVTLTTLAPDSTALIGLSIGSWNGTACAIGIAKTDATQGTTVIGNASGTGNYCAYVNDSTGRLTAPVEYQITVTHF